jgi:hypothetical protein
MSGVRRLVDYPWVLVRVRCEMCKRAGAYRLARLAVKYGAEILLDDLIVRLSFDCPWRDEPRGSCGALRCGGLDMASVDSSVADKGVSILTRWTRNAILWRYPLFALLFVLADYIVDYLGAHSDDYFPLGLFLLIVGVLLLAASLVLALTFLVKRRVKLAFTLALAAIVLSSSTIFGQYGGPMFSSGIDRVRFHFFRDRYAAIIDRMSPQERASNVVFFDWGGSGFLSTSLSYWVVYDESGEISRPDAERSQAWIERVRLHNSVINSHRCMTEAFRLSGHYYSATTLCQ